MISRYGRYEVLYKLGQGAMAQVFLARDPLLMRFVAVKVLHADLAARKDVLQRFFTEARTVAAVRNPHVVEVFDFGQEGKDLFLVMEFVDGLSLLGLLRQIGLNNPASAFPPQGSADKGLRPTRPLDAALTAALMCQAAEGLSVASQHGVVHRDIKPENLLINQQGYLKISDFGIAHVQDESITKTGAVLGSPLFMSPEQARGLKPITSQADMFSLGAVFYACLAGYPPFQGRTITEIFRKISTEPQIPIGQIRPELDPFLAALIDTLLQKDPDQRGSGPRWLHRQLKSHLAAGAIDAPELIAAYLQELSAQGVQTTWRMESDARAGTLAASTLPGFQPSATLLPEPQAGNAFRSGFLPTGTMQSGSVELGAISATDRYAEDSDQGARSRTYADANTPEETFHPENASGMPIAALVAAIAVLLLAAAGGWWGYRHFAKIPAGDARVHLENYPEKSGNAAGAGEGQRAVAAEAAYGREHVPDRRDGNETVPLDAGPVEVVTGEKVLTGDPASVSDPGRGESASLLLKSAPPFAEAYIDGRYMGVTPVKVENLIAGSHHLLLKIKGEPVFDTTLAVKPGPIGFKFNLQAGKQPRLAVMPEAEP